MKNPILEGPCFAGLTVNTEPETLDAGLAVIGLPYDSPYPGLKTYSTLNSVKTIREASYKYGPLDRHDFDLNGPVLGENPPACVDCGNFVNDRHDFDSYRRAAADTIAALVSKDVVPAVIGGDHGTTIPVLEGMRSYQDLCVVQIDAHLDWVDERNGVSCGYSSPMRRAAEMDNVKSLVQIGLRSTGSAGKKEVGDAVECSKVTLIKAETLHDRGITAIIDMIPSAPFYYLTVDADGLDPSIAPGVAYPAPGGVTYYQLLKLMKGLASMGKLVGMDFVEVVPEKDLAGLTSLFAARQILNFLGIAARQ